jgi:hypothetical protein
LFYPHLLDVCVYVDLDVEYANKHTNSLADSSLHFRLIWLAISKSKHKLGCFKTSYSILQMLLVKALTYIGRTILHLRRQ